MNNLKNTNNPSELHKVLNFIKRFFIAIAMLIFNLVFMLTPFIFIWTIFIILIALTIALFVFGFLIFISTIFSFTFLSYTTLLLQHPALAICLSFILTGMGGILTVILFYVIKFAGILTYKYVKWNLKIIIGH